jgi:electron transfer flavoprotein alpha subunit
MSNILVIAELHDGHVRKSTHSAINFARQAGLPFSILVLGQGAKAAAAEVTTYGAAKVITVDDAYLANAVAERFAPTVAEVAKSGGYDIVVVTASSFGKDIAPRIAAKLGAGYAPDISSVSAAGGKHTYKRPVFAGNAFASCEVTTPVQVVSVRQSEFAPAEASGGASPIEDKTPDAYGVDVAPRIEVMKTTEPPGRNAGAKEKTVAELVEKLKHEAGVI